MSEWIPELIIGGGFAGIIIYLAWGCGFIGKGFAQTGEKEKMQGKGSNGIGIPICCGTCKWHYHEDIDDGYICVNADSDYCADWTDDDDRCEDWEERDT